MQRPFGAPRFHLDENASSAAPPLASPPPAAPPPSAPPPSPSGSGAEPPSGPYRPEGLPDHLAGANDRETVDKLFKAFDGYRRGEAERGAVPKTAADYAFEASDKLKPFVQNFDKDPVYAAARDIAHKAGMTDKVFKAFIPGLLEHLVEGGLVDQPVDAKAQLRTLAPSNVAGDDAAKEAAGAKRVRDNVAWVDGAKAQGAFGDPNDPGAKEIADFFASTLASDPRAHRAIEWLRGKDAEPRPALPASGSGAGTADLTARINDPRGNPNSPQFDRAFAAETDRMLQQQYGN